MRIGPSHWRWVSIDSAGVPHGGPYGRVRDWANVLSRHGLTVGWSRLHRCFGVCSHRGKRWVCHMLLQRTSGGPIPFTRKLINLLLYAWNRHCRYTSANIASYVRNLRRKQRDRQLHEQYRDRQYILKDLAREAARSKGLKGRPIFSFGKAVTRG